MYTVEYVRMLAEQAASGEVDPDVELTIPETVHGVIANRIDRLGGPQRMVLHAAAALGESVWPGAVAAMLGQPANDVGRSLGALRSRDMLVAGTTSMVAGEPELKFRHQLLRDVAYGRLPRAARASLHRRAAAWLDRLPGARRPHLLAAPAPPPRAAPPPAQGPGGDNT